MRRIYSTKMKSTLLKYLFSRRIKSLNKESFESGLLLMNQDKTSFQEKRFSQWIFNFVGKPLIVACLIFAVEKANGQVTTGRATLGTNISADKAANSTSPAGGTFTTLGNITIREGIGVANRGNIATTVAQIVLNAPIGWNFQTSGVTATATGGDIVTGTITYTTTAITIPLTVNSIANRDLLTISGVSVKASSGSTLPGSGNITPTFTGTISGLLTTTNLGSLSQIAGTVTNLAFSTQPGSVAYGSVITARPVVVSKDQFSNNSRFGLGATVNATVAIASGTGSLSGTTSVNIGTAGGNGTATFSTLRTTTIGAKTISATAPGLTVASSNSFTISAISLTLTATSSAKIYGTALTAATGSGFSRTSGTYATGESATSVTLTPDAAGLSAATPAGTAYTVTPSLATGTGGFLASNYNITYIPFNGIVTRKALTVTATGPSKTYGTALIAGTSSINFTASATGIGSETVTSVTLTPNASGLSATRAAGLTYVVTPSLATGTGGFLASNYTITYVAFNGIVTKKALTVTATGPLKTYGTALITGTSSTNFIAGATGVGTQTVTRVTLTPDAAGLSSTTSVGVAYVVTPSLAIGGGGFLASNYNITYIPFNGIVTAKALTVTATGPSKSYGTALTAGISNTNFTAATGVGGQTITSVTLTPDAAGLSASTAAGLAYIVTPSLATGTGGFLASNYNITYASFNGNVTAKALTVNATGPSKTYGTALIAGTSSTNFTASTTGIGSETVTSVTLTPNAFGLSATRAAGLSYVVTPSLATGTGGFLASNYTITYVPFNGIVTRKALTVTATGPLKTYGTALVTGTSGTNFTAGATGIGTQTVTRVTLTPDAAGLSSTTSVGVAYVVTPSLATGGGGFLASNYNITYIPFNGTVTAKALTVTATGPSKSYGTALTAGTSSTNFTAGATGVGTQTVTSVTLTPNAAGLSATVLPGAAYVVTPSLATGSGGFLASNYNITYVPFNGIVTRKALTVTATGPSKTYGTALTAGISSTNFTAGATGVGSEIVTSVRLTPNAFGLSATRAAGLSYAVTPSLATGTGGFLAGNYTITYVPFNGIVTAKALTVTATGPSKAYGTALTAGTSVTNFTAGATGVGTQTVTGVTLTPNAAGLSATTAAGAAYTVTPSLATGTGGFLASNYNITYVPFNGTVTAKALTVTATGPSKPYGTALTAGTSSTNFTAGATGVGTETVTSITLTPDAAGLSATTAAGAAYVVTPSLATGAGGFLASNYNITYIPFNGTVTVASLTITANNQSKCAGTSFTFTDTEFTTAGLQNSEIVGSVILTSAGAASGSAVNTYSIVPSAATGGTFISSNYTITYSNGTLTVNPTPSTPTISGTPSLCAGGSTTLTSSAGAGNQWYKDAVILGGETGTTLSITTAGTYTVVVTLSTCPSAISTGTVVTITSNQWISTGITGQDRNWSNGLNWSCGAPPSAGSNIIIAAGATLFPQLPYGVNPVLNDVTLPAGKTFDIAGQTLTINGAVTGTGTITGSDTSNLVIFGAAGTLNFTQTGTGSYLKNFTLNTGATAILGNALNITGGTAANTEGKLTVTGSAVLTTGGLLTIKSNIYGTASIAANTNGGTYISGNVTVERYIPQNTNRAWRLLTAPTNGQTIKQSWQEGQAAGVNGLDGFGTNITSSSASWSADGFDFKTASSSLLTFDQASNTLPGVANTSAAVNAASGYFMYIRGSRSNTPSSSTSAGAATTLRTTGTLNLGNQTAISIPADKSALIGNPYASSLDLRNIVLAGGCTGASFNVWDPKLLGSYNLGAYQTLSFDGSDFIVVPGGGSFGPSGSVNNFIESGAAFFTRAVASPGTVTINETSKGTGSRMVFRPAGASSKETFITNLYAKNSNAYTMADGNMIVFDPANNDAIDGFDAIKRTNFGENFSILKNGKNLVIEKRASITAADTISFRMYNMKKLDYRLQLVTANMQQPNTTAFLEDTYLATSKAINLSDTTYHDFTVDANVGSIAQNRFRIVFRPISVLPVSFTNIKATVQNKQIAVEWRVENQINIREYEVEKSANGRDFVKAATTVSTGLNGSTVTYNWVDMNPANALNYYRIKSVDANGTFKFSGVVKATIGKTNATILVTPNLITGNTMNLQFTNQVKGKYTLRLLNNSGQLVYSSQKVHNGGNELQSINLPSAIPTGSYQLEIIAHDNSRQIQKLVIQQNK